MVLPPDPPFNASTLEPSQTETIVTTIATRSDPSDWLGQSMFISINFPPITVYRHQKAEMAIWNQKVLNCDTSPENTRWISSIPVGAMNLCILMHADLSLLHFTSERNREPCRFICTHLASHCSHQSNTVSGSRFRGMFLLWGRGFLSQM